MHFTLGSRLGEAWRLDSADLYTRLKKSVGEHLPFLESIESPHHAAIAGEELGLTGDAGAQRAIGYAYARAGQIPKAITMLDRYVKMSEGDDREWVVMRREEVLNLRNLLLTKPDAALKQLESWEAETVTALALT
jgi:hypothetical protein